MRAILRRVGRLEDRFALDSSGKPRLGVRVIVGLPWKGAANLAKSTCRRLLRAGGITDIVELDGDDASISEEELETFIASFPIRSASERSG
ncbi:MAG: hypothetical protein ABSG41_21215 [Bryobacteraceae bacterium]|jgi:hypothetical protein